MVANGKWIAFVSSRPYTKIEGWGRHDHRSDLQCFGEPSHITIWRGGSGIEMVDNDTIVFTRTGGCDRGGEGDQGVTF